MILPRIDLHVHTTASDGAGTLKQVIARARKKGLAVLAVADHFADPGRFCAREADLIRYADQIAAGGHGLQVLLAVEAGPQTRLPSAVATKLDLVIRSVHSYPGMKRETTLFDDELWEGYKEWVLKTIALPNTDILGHVEGYLPLPAGASQGTSFQQRRWLEKEVARRYFDRSWQEAVARAAVAHGVAIEVHAGSESPRPEFLKRCLEYGVKFSIGSDAHLLEDVGKIDWAVAALEEIGATAANLIELPGMSSAADIG